MELGEVHRVVARSLQFGEGCVTVGDLPVRRRILRWLASPPKPFFVALVPDRHVGPEVMAGRYGWPLLCAIACACIAAFALGSRLDVGPEVRAENAGEVVKGIEAGAAQAPDIKTDREIDEAIEQRAAIVRVQLGTGAVAGTPVRVLALGLALLLLARFVGGKPTMARMLTVAALASIPGAVRSLVTAIVAWRQDTVVPSEFDALVQVPALIEHPILARLLDGVDVFTWWSVIVIAFGLSAGAEITRRKGFLAIAIGFVVYLLITRIIMGAPGR